MFGGEKAAMPTFRELSAVKWGATRARAPPLHIVSALVPQILNPPPNSFEMPLQHPDTGKTNKFGGFGPSSFRIFHFFPFCPFFLFYIRIFRFLAGRSSEETVPQHKVYFSFPIPRHSNPCFFCWKKTSETHQKNKVSFLQETLNPWKRKTHKKWQGKSENNKKTRKSKKKKGLKGQGCPLPNPNSLPQNSQTQRKNNHAS